MLRVPDAFMGMDLSPEHEDTAAQAQANNEILSTFLTIEILALCEQAWLISVSSSFEGSGVFSNATLRITLTRWL